MFNRVAVISLVLIFTGSLYGQAAGNEQEIRAAYDAYFAALRHKDLDGAMKFVNSDFSGRLPDGVVLDRAGQAENLKEQVLFDITIGEARVIVEQVQSDGADLVATVRTVLFYSDSDAPDAKPTSFNDDHLRDTWTHTADGWKLKSSVYLRNTISGSLTPESVPPESPRLKALLEQWKAGNKEALGDFWKSMEGKAPLVEEMKVEEKAGDKPGAKPDDKTNPGDRSTLLVTFLWRSNSANEKVGVYGGLPSEDVKPLVRLADTDVWYLTEHMPADSRGTYVFQIQGFLNGSQEHYTATAPDPFNPLSFSQGSYFELPKAPAQSYIKPQPGVPHGSLTRLKIKSTILKNEDRDYGVYTPAGYSKSGKPYDLVLLFDGEVWGNGADNLVPTPTILDNLIAQKKIPPTVLVMVNSMNQPWRNRDLTCSPVFADFLVKELLPEVRKSYRVTSDPKHVVVGGSSFGGLASACAGLMHPEAFGNVLSMSGSYWYIPNWEKTFNTFYLEDSGWVMRQYLESPKLPLRFYLEVGRYEGLSRQMPTNRDLRDILKLKGYPLTYSEFDGGHDYLCWRGSVADGLIALLGNPGD